MDLVPVRAASLLALVAAAEAALAAEVPVGAVVRHRLGWVLAQCGNRTLAEVDPSGHAEMLALRLAARRTGSHRLSGAALAVSLEPCPMCLAVAWETRLTAVSWSTPREEAKRSVSAVTGQRLVESGGHGEASAGLLRFFFEPRRHSC